MSKQSKTVSHQSSDKSIGNSIMDQLMASYDNRRLKLDRGEQVSGEVTSITDSEIILDLKAKAEGVLSKKDLSVERLQSLKIGDKLDVFIVAPETESGQIIVSMFKVESISNRGGRGGRKIDMSKWQKFIQGKETGATYFGEITEINRGGLIVSLDGIRGFIPSSQVSLRNLSHLDNLNDLIGQSLRLSVIEVDPNNNKLVFSSRPVLNDEEKKQLSSYEVGNEVIGKILAVTPFGLFVIINPTPGVFIEGIVYPQETTWSTFAETSADKGSEIDLTKNYKAGAEITAKIIGIDEKLGRLNLSLRQMEEDPFTKEAEKYQVDDVVTGVITNITQNGVDVKLENMLGFLPVEKMEGQKYQMGQKTNFLIDSIDLKNRRINLAPFLTSTVGLIYK